MFLHSTGSVIRGECGAPQHSPLRPWPMSEVAGTQWCRGFLGPKIDTEETPLPRCALVCNWGTASVYCSTRHARGALALAQRRMQDAGRRTQDAQPGCSGSNSHRLSRCIHTNQPANQLHQLLSPPSRSFLPASVAFHALSASAPPSPPPSFQSTRAGHCSLSRSLQPCRLRSLLPQSSKRILTNALAFSTPHLLSFYRLAWPGHQPGRCNASSSQPQYAPGDGRPLASSQHVHFVFGPYPWPPLLELGI